MEPTQRLRMRWEGGSIVSVCGVCCYNSLPLNEWTDMLLYLFMIYLIISNDMMNMFSWYMWEYVCRVCLTVDLTIILTIPSLGLLFTCHFSLIVVLEWAHSPSFGFKGWSYRYSLPPSRERSQHGGSGWGGESESIVCMLYADVILSHWMNELRYSYSCSWSI